MNGNTGVKVMFLIESMASESGGTAIEIVKLTEELVKVNGVQITVACNTAKSSSLQVSDKVNFFQFSNPVFPRLSWFKAIYHLKKLIDTHDIIFSTGIWGPIDGFALRIAWKKDKPIYIRVCGMLEPYILSRHRLKKQIAMYTYLKKNLNSAKGIIVNSSTEALNVDNITRSPEKIFVIPNGVNVYPRVVDKQKARQSLGIRLDEKVLLYLGRIHPKKGLHYLLKAMAELPSSDKAFTLIVGGEFADSNYRTMIMQMVDDLNLNNAVKFTGLILGEEKENYFWASDCFILPSQSEGLPNAVLEAMAHGLPVIITSGCNIPEISDCKAGLVIDLSIKNLITALKWFLSDNNQLRKASENAVQFVKDRFDPKVTSKMYEEIIFSQ